MGSETIAIHLTARDMAETRFAYSPLLEIVTSYRVFISPETDFRYRLWVDEARRALYGHELSYLQALISWCRYIPDFLTPTPLLTTTSLEEELQQMMRTPDEVIRNNIQQLIEANGETEMLRDFLVYPRELLYCLIEDLRLYWERGLARHWPRMKSTLDDDILYHARKLALGGYPQLFEDLSSELSYRPGEIIISRFNKIPSNTIELGGRGIQLVPAIFSWSKVLLQIALEWQPMLIYMPRGTGLWWRETPKETDPSLEIALGAGRARVLQGLTTPASTGELARRLTLSDGAVSQHLSRLRQAGLAESRRSGKKVYYSLTTRGEHLLALFDSSSLPLL